MVWGGLGRSPIEVEQPGVYSAAWPENAARRVSGVRGRSFDGHINQPATESNTMSDTEFQTTLDQRPQIANTTAVSTEEALAELGKLKGKVVLVTGKSLGQVVTRSLY